MTAPSFTVRGLGETVLRVADLDRSLAFYRDVFGLRLLRRFDDRIAFLEIEDGFEGHKRILGLFAHTAASNREGRTWPGLDPDRTTLHHFAFEIALAEHEAALQRLTALGLAPNTAIHAWIGWRSIYISDPDGNTVELVAADPSVQEASP